MYTCGNCGVLSCDSGKMEQLPKNCPCSEVEEQEKVKALYFEEENYKISHNGAVLEAEGYCKKTRLEETMDFAHRCGYKNLGVAFCIGLKKEAKILCDVLRHNGFEVNSVACKNGSIPKEFINIKESEKIEPGSFEPMCNPIGQANFLNNAKTDFNIILGLCVGHDSLFIKYAEAPVTVLVVKDRVLGHNPVAALYQSEGYYKSKLYK